MYSKLLKHVLNMGPMGPRGLGPWAHGPQLPGPKQKQRKGITQKDMTNKDITNKDITNKGMTNKQIHNKKDITKDIHKTPVDRHANRITRFVSPVLDVQKMCMYEKIGVFCIFLLFWQMLT